MSCLPVLAQDPAYKGAAKMDVTTFWRQIEIFKNGKGGSSNYTNLEKALASTRQKDPSYNTASMEAEMKVWKDKVNQENAEQVTKANQQQANMDAARNGSLSDIKVLGRIDSRKSEAVIKILKSSPQWSPGKQNAKIVRVSYVIPL